MNEYWNGGRKQALQAYRLLSTVIVYTCMANGPTAAEAAAYIFQQVQDNYILWQ
jgi:hypothetical protein